ncbi:hypothetical protein DPMN_110948 [Dreissena polymorpha]|uniref:Uncharacterized protein n=1 Tax=Dreissena polymorpha TaxID=45954 RepID=A0A9D4QPF0_DREPO|nr:hypothetical protein DPMN_110948 [Dreissena polymorpha]
MKSVKTENRSRLKSAVHNDLIIVSIEKPEMEAVDFEGIVDVWKQDKPRRTGVFF